ncbi:unnamed protein product [Phytophthora fragariaefolia]|uniref:Unnamed protein product n=1 Tax=Phytophthora fragariaefolia TaxID=1490495 RepID=A0A9W6U983_9STRA|nr:unnamed protein product [Phytophthora fragariaefolia]
MVDLGFYCLAGRSFASQDPRSRNRKRQAQERKTRKGKGHPTRQPRAGSRSRVLDPRHPDLNRKTTGSGHYTASSVRISTLVAKIPKSRQDIHSSTLGHFTSYQRSRSSPTDGWEVGSSNLADFADPPTPQWCACPDSNQGFHRESLEDVQVKIELGDQASSELGSTTTRLNEVRSTDRQSARRTSVGGTEADPDPDREDKPQPPPQVPSGTPVDLDPRQDPPTKQTKAGRERYGFADSMAKPERYISPSRKSTRSGGI